MRLILLAALLLCTHLMSGNNGPYRLGNFEQNIIVKHSRSDINGRKILEALAQGNNKPLHATEIRYSFTARLGAELKGNRWVLGVTGSSIQIGGDNYYRGMNMGSALLPATIGYSVRLSTAGSAQNNYEFNNIYISGGAPVPAEKNINDSVTALTRAEVLQPHAEFNATVLQAVMQRISFINEYYSAASQVDNAIMLLNSIYAGNIDQFELEDKKLHDAEAVIAGIEACDYTGALDLHSYDPAQLLNKLSAAKSLAAVKHNEISAAMATIHLAFFDRGLFFMQRNDYHAASGYFTRSLQANPSFAPALYQLARIDFTKKKYEEVIGKCDEILFRLNPDPQTRSDAERLIYDVYEMHLDRGTALLNRKDFSGAEKDFLHASELCRKYSGIRCTEEMYNGIKKARTGIYQNYLQDAASWLQKGSLDKAEETVAKADEYYTKHRDDVTQSQSSADILKSIKQERFNRYWNTAQAASSKKNFEEAMAAFEEAETLKSKYGLTSSSQYASVLKSTSRSYVAQQIEKGESNATANRLADAKINLESGRSVLTRYLDNDKSLSEKINALEGKIISTECLNAQQELKAIHANGKLAAAQGKYVEAYDAYASAKAIKESHTHCNLDEGTLAEDNSAILPAATYLKLTGRAEQEMKSFNYKESFNHYSEAEKYYGQFDVGRFNIPHMPQKEYILTRSSDGMVYYAADRYRTMKDYDQSLMLYKKLVEGKYDNKALRGSLYNLGFDLARKDKAQSPGSSWKSSVKKYLSADKAWKQLEKGYKKGWKA